jgi:hypothetical protein
VEQVPVSNRSASGLPRQPEISHRRVFSGDRQPQTPTFQDLALGHIKLLAERDEFEVHRFSGGIEVKMPNCSFCLYACDYGISNEGMCLPEDASGVFCDGCNRGCEQYRDIRYDYPLTDSPYPFERWGYLSVQNGKALRETSEKQKLKQVAKTYERSIPAPHNTNSQIDGKDISAYQGLHFCRGNPWKQVDLAKVVICKGCKEEKLDIIKHRHKDFSRIVEEAEVDAFGRVIYHPKQKRCMVCTGLATEKCEGCPLRLCSTCEVYLRTLGE